ncbi:hypothetical protein O0L34_g4225 [Tuta absoluta]|nr:hypothetical protein O0L34_g4225 [Tuta absoluta]
MLLSVLPIVIKRSLFAFSQPASIIYTRKYSSKPAPVRWDAHMNELPIPCGPWDTYYRERQSYYNKVLIAGAIWWLLSCIMMVSTGSFFLNWGPPLHPAPPSDMIEECSDD